MHYPLDKTDQLKNLEQKHWLCHYSERAAWAEVNALRKALYSEFVENGVFFILIYKLA